MIWVYPHFRNPPIQGSLHFPWHLCHGPAPAGAQAIARAAGDAVTFEMVEDWWAVSGETGWGDSSLSWKQCSTKLLYHASWFYYERVHWLAQESWDRVINFPMVFMYSHLHLLYAAKRPSIFEVICFMSVPGSTDVPSSNRLVWFKMIYPRKKWMVSGPQNDP